MMKETSARERVRESEEKPDLFCFNASSASEIEIEGGNASQREIEAGRWVSSM